jgi:hypothetical protein
METNILNVQRGGGGGSDILSLLGPLSSSLSGVRLTNTTGRFIMFSVITNINNKKLLYHLDAVWFKHQTLTQNPPHFCFRHR